MIQTYYVKFNHDDSNKQYVSRSFDDYDEAKAYKATINEKREPFIFGGGDLIETNDGYYLMAHDGRAISLVSGRYENPRVFSRVKVVYGSEIMW